MEFVTLKEIDKKVYDDFVAANESGSFLQSWDWGAWQEQLGRKVSRFFIKDEETILLSASVILTPIGKKQYCYIPHGPLAAETLNVAGVAAAYDFFISGLQETFPKSIFIRLEPKQPLPSTKHSLQRTKNIQPAQTLIIDLPQPESALLSAMHPKTRYNIKVAAKHDVTVHAEPAAIPQHGLYLKESVDLIVETAKRQKFKTYPASYYESLINFFGRTSKNSNVHLEIYQALYQTKLLACALIVDFGKSRTYLFGGSSHEHKNVMAPYLMHWQEILDAQARGLRYYDFWGLETSSGNQAGFARFKQGFGGRIQTYPGTFDVIQNSAWYTMYKLVRIINRIRNKIV